MNIEMIRKTKLIVYLFSVIAFIFVFVDDVKGDIWGAAGSPGACEGCFGVGSPNVVQMKMWATGYRVSLLASNGKQINGTYSVDYWPSNTFKSGRGFYSLTRDGWSDLNGFSGMYDDKDNVYYQTILSFAKKRPKTELNDSNTGFKDLSMADYFESGKYNRKNFIVQDTKTYMESGYSAQHYNWLDGEWGDKFNNNNYTKRALEELYPKVNNSKHTDSDYRYVAQLLRNSNYASDISAVRDNPNNMSVSDAKKIIAKATQDNVFLAVEPVMALQILNRNFTEYKGHKSNKVNEFIVNPKMVGTSAEMYYLDLAAFDVGWGYPKVSHLHPIVYAKGDGSTVAGIKTCTSLNNDNVSLASAGDPKNCLGIFVFNIREGFDNCDSEARKYIATYKDDRNNKGMKRTEAKNKFMESLYNTENTKRCVKKEHVDAGSVHLDYYTIKEECGVLDSINKHSAPDDKYYDNLADVCSKEEKKDCTTEVNTLFKDYFETDRVEYEKKLAELLEEIPEHKNDNLLDTATWQSLGYSGPKCENEEPQCDTTVPNIVCEYDSISFTDSDNKTKNGKECYKVGVAYNNYGTQSSEAVDFETKEKTVFCKEYVTLNLPGQPDDVAAGTVLKWGTDKSKKNDIFGSMVVSRECSAKDNSINLSKPFEWADYIKTIVTVNIKANGGTNYSQSLNTKLTGIRFGEDNSPENHYKTSNGSSYSCSSFSGCDSINNNGGDFFVQAYYDFVYDQNLHWYSDKNGEKGNKVAGDYSSSPNHLELGYGFPIEFTERHRLYDLWDAKLLTHKWSDLDSVDGYLYASIKNIGTKNSDNTYHFDKLIKVGSDQSDSYDSSNNALRYTCPFTTSNPLMDAECFDKDGNKYPLGSPYCKDEEKPKGLDVVFRTVQLINVKDCNPDDTGVCKGDATTINNDLNTAFPGRTGKGRYTNGKKIGSNWLTIDEDENKNTKRIFDILDNMIYAQPYPSYHIVLDTGKINYIREQNKKYRDGTIDDKDIKSDPYTDSRYFKFDKTNATDYAYGASEFISDLANRSWIDGDCTSGDTDARAKNGPCRQT